MYVKFLFAAILFIIITALSIVVRFQYVENVRLKLANQSIIAKRDAARAQFTHYEKVVDIFNTIAGATQDAHQQAIHESQPEMVEIQKAITPERCARLPVPTAAVNRLRAHANKISPRAASTHSRNVTR
ncbi:hypothetical protein ARAF_0704 [Arsenophonus endosymbiont of Aleurodicus floccissimus]|uniref:hypothetical protein n=1 Tax=Arsenophonus endosymbiont of Aleurodicus floccissimus TaxID=2152761 RepID=UPI000E6B0957|nr:hypothetical protein [Arsenophonus endosymbiont of Aleurodicus floccissimus]SPP31570.1 hypothetical protein ARAF_0704 [Arsenophonus endosymbiont of Aleurodicus floccissimus]